MRERYLLGFLILVLPVAANAQNILPRKDIAFAQIAAGGGYTTILNVTNRGTTTYNGTLSLFRVAGEEWNPLINEIPVSNGKLNIALGKGATASYQITLPGGTEAGFAVIKASGMEQTSFLEGTLTYFVKSGSTLTDSIGVQPSSEFYLATLPFDDFSTLALALANANTTKTTVRMTVVSETNAQVGTLDLPLDPNQHMAQYLWQLFPSVSIQKGRLDIRSDLPVLGTALTDQSGQLSSLPLLPAVKAYTFTGRVLGVTLTGELSVWIDGSSVQGYLRTLAANGQPESHIDTLNLRGALVNNVLQWYTSGPPGQEGLLSFGIINPFLPPAATQQGQVWFFNNLNQTLLAQSTVTFTAIN
jgi:hypothetical protein